MGNVEWKKKVFRNGKSLNRAAFCCNILTDSMEFGQMQSIQWKIKLHKGLPLIGIKIDFHFANLYSHGNIE